MLLGVGRAVGETMAVLMATGHAVQIPTGLLDPVRTLTATIAAELGEVARAPNTTACCSSSACCSSPSRSLVNLAADLVVRGVRRR